MNPYKDESSNPKWNAQRNLCGRTHYVDDDTLRFHKSRVLSTHITDNGLLFALIESCSLDMHNTRRGYRYVIFDIFGTVLARPDLEQCYNTRRAAECSMWDVLSGIDAKAQTLLAISKTQQRHNEEMNELRQKVRCIGQRKAA